MINDTFKNVLVFLDGVNIESNSKLKKIPICIQRIKIRIVEDQIKVNYCITYRG